MKLHQRGARGREQLRVRMHSMRRAPRVQAHARLRGRAGCAPRSRAAHAAQSSAAATHETHGRGASDVPRERSWRRDKRREGGQARRRDHDCGRAAAWRGAGGDVAAVQHRTVMPCRAHPSPWTQRNLTWQPWLTNHGRHGDVAGFTGLSRSRSCLKGRQRERAGGARGGQLVRRACRARRTTAGHVASCAALVCTSCCCTSR